MAIMAAAVAFGVATVVASAAPAVGTQEPGTTTVIVRFEPQGVDVAGKDLRLWARTVEEPVATQEAPVRQDLTVSVVLPNRGGWRIGCAGDSVFCPRVEVPARAAAHEPVRLSVPVFRATSLRGRVRASAGDALPATLLMQGRARHRDTVFEVEDEATLSDGAFTFSVPQTGLDLRLSARGRVPLYLWDQRPSGPVLDVGVLDLRRGASVSGFVVDPRDGKPMAGVEARLGPFAADVPETTAQPTWSTLTTVRALSQRTGFFQIVDVAPGRYSLELGRPGQPATKELPVEIADDAETSLGEIALEKPVAFAVTVSPALAPSGRPWTVALRSRPAGSVFFFESQDRETNGSGTARFEALRRGSYQLAIHDGEGSYFHREELELAEARHAMITLPLVKVRGKVTLGRSPLQAALSFTADETDRQVIRSGPDGHFEGLIRRPALGYVTVAVTSEAPAVSRVFVERDVDARADVLEMDLRVEDLRVSGIVVDHEGRPVGGARVTADLGTWLTVNTETSSDGRFELEGLPPGRVAVKASHDSYSAPPPTEIDLSAAEPSTSLTLTLNRGRLLRGTLLSASGERVPGARIALLEVGAAPPRVMLETDRSGNFDVVLGANASQAHLVVMAPTHLLWSGCVSLSPAADEFTVALPPLPGATLRIRAWRPARPQGPPWTDGEFFLVHDGGGVVTGTYLRIWSSTLGEREVRGVENGREYREWKVPSVASGGYAVVTSPTRYDAYASASCMAGNPLPGWQYVGPGGELSLVHDFERDSTTRAEKRVPSR